MVAISSSKESQSSLETLELPKSAIIFVMGSSVLIELLWMGFGVEAKRPAFCSLDILVNSSYVIVFPAPQYNPVRVKNELFWLLGSFVYASALGIRRTLFRNPVGSLKSLAVSQAKALRNCIFSGNCLTAEAVKQAHYFIQAHFYFFVNTKAQKKLTKTHNWSFAAASRVSAAPFYQCNPRFDAVSSFFNHRPVLPGRMERIWPPLFPGGLWVIPFSTWNEGQ
jgi:hypothetical protein